MNCVSTSKVTSNHTYLNFNELKIITE